MNSLPRTDKREPGQEAGVTQPITGKYALQSNKHVLVLLKPVNWYFLIDRLTHDVLYIDWPAALVALSIFHPLGRLDLA